MHELIRREDMKEVSGSYHKDLRRTSGIDNAGYVSRRDGKSGAFVLNINYNLFCAVFVQFPWTRLSKSKMTKKKYILKSYTKSSM
jgi:hypothetical protein